MSVKNSTGLLAFVTTVGLIGAVGYVATSFSNKLAQNREDVVAVAATEVPAKVAAATAEEPKQEPVPDIVQQDKEEEAEKNIIIDEYTPRQPVIEEEKVLNKRLKEVEDAERVEKEYERKVKAAKAAEPVKLKGPVKTAERKSITRRVIAKFTPKRPAWLKPKPREKTVVAVKKVPTQPIRPAPPRYEEERFEERRERFDPFFIPKFFFGALVTGVGAIVDMKQKMLGLDE